MDGGGAEGRFWEGPRGEEKGKDYVRMLNKLNKTKQNVTETAQEKYYQC